METNELLALKEAYQNRNLSVISNADGNRTENRKTVNIAVSSKKVLAFLQGENLSQEDIASLSSEERAELKERIIDGVDLMDGEDREKSVKKLDGLMDDDLRTYLWENNHLLIQNAISQLIRKMGSMPSRSEIARKTGLARRTVTRHLQNFKQNSLYAEMDEKYKIMKQSMLDALIQEASNGNVKAVRLYLEAIGEIGNSRMGNKSIIENQNNYIQINETRLNQAQIEKLSPERLRQLEAIVNEAGAEKSLRLEVKE